MDGYLGQGGLLQARLVVQQRELVVAAHQLRAQQVALPGNRLRLAPLPQPLLAMPGMLLGRRHGRAPWHNMHMCSLPCSKKKL